MLRLRSALKAISESANTHEVFLRFNASEETWTIEIADRQVTGYSAIWVAEEMARNLRLPS